MDGFFKRSAPPCLQPRAAANPAGSACFIRPLGTKRFPFCRVRSASLARAGEKPTALQFWRSDGHWRAKGSASPLVRSGQSASPWGMVNRIKEVPAGRRTIEAFHSRLPENRSASPQRRLEIRAPAIAGRLERSASSSRGGKRRRRPGPGEVPGEALPARRWRSGRSAATPSRWPRADGRRRGRSAPRPWPCRRAAGHGQGSGAVSSWENWPGPSRAAASRRRSAVPAAGGHS